MTFSQLGGFSIPNETVQNSERNGFEFVNEIDTFRDSKFNFSSLSGDAGRLEGQLMQHSKSLSWHKSCNDGVGKCHGSCTLIVVVVEEVLVCSSTFILSSSSSLCCCFFVKSRQNEYYHYHRQLRDCTVRVRSCGVGQQPIWSG